ncbi:MAG: SDR family oxidoreductase [Alphaproteobacteria bacterium]|nr:SDR family oxidoreductase [Alphaproteobacteria bacterium]
MTDFSGKIALVTGGSRGIGAAIVARLRADGATVITCGRGERPADLAEDVDWVSMDVSSGEDVSALKDHIISRHGRLNLLVNNAGVQVEKPVTESTDEDWDQVMGINAKGVFLTCRGFIPVMAEHGGGAIVNIGSISGNHADPSMALYNASKAFVHGLTRSIAVDHGAQGVRCNAICPGWIMTGMADAAFDLAKNPAAAKQDALARHAAGRFGEPDDIAKAAAWLLSDEAGFVTGQTFTVDGGLVAASPLQPGLS